VDSIISYKGEAYRSVEDTYDEPPSEDWEAYTIRGSGRRVRQVRRSRLALPSVQAPVAKYQVEKQTASSIWNDPSLNSRDKIYKWIDSKRPASSGETPWMAGPGLDDAAAKTLWAQVQKAAANYGVDFIPRAEDREWMSLAGAGRRMRRGGINKLF
jgi:hypothetical protein